MKKLAFAVLLFHALLTTNALAQQQKTIFCTEKTSFNAAERMDAGKCQRACASFSNTDTSCLSSQTDKGWQVVSSSPSEAVPPGVYGNQKCVCIGTKYVLTPGPRPETSKGSTRTQVAKPDTSKGSTQTSAKDSLPEKEIDLLKKEIELLKKENQTRKKEIENLQNAGNKK